MSTCVNCRKPLVYQAWITADNKGACSELCRNLHEDNTRNGLEVNVFGRSKSHEKAQ
jgi:hypothetical protein